MREDRFYSVYVQARHEDGRRVQWIILPRRGVGAPRLYFTRLQNGPNHRSRWVDDWDRLAQPLIPRVVSLEYYERIGYQVDPPVTARLSETELKALEEYPKTPWFLINRFKATAQNLRDRAYTI